MQIVVVEVRANKVRLGIEAPDAIRVDRGEVVLMDAAKRLDETLTAQAARELLRGLSPKRRTALLKQVLDDEVCLGCGCNVLRCRCLGGSGLLLPAMAGAAS